MTPDAADGEPWLVVGLGNPGPRYARNRHNVGAMVLDHLAAACDVRFSVQKGLRADVAQARLAPAGGRPGVRLILAKPTSFMNESGGPVSGVLRYFSLAPARLLVVHDELDLQAGEVRLKFGGGEGGHNGLRSISASLATKDYARLRLGVGRPPGRMDAADYVLQDFPLSDRIETELLIGEGVEAVELVARQGLESAQQVVNTRGTPAR